MRSELKARCSLCCCCVRALRVLSYSLLLDRRASNMCTGCPGGSYSSRHPRHVAAGARCREAAPTSASRTPVAESPSGLPPANCVTAAAPSAQRRIVPCIDSDSHRGNCLLHLQMAHVTGDDIELAGMAIDLLSRLVACRHLLEASIRWRSESVGSCTRLQRDRFALRPKCRLPENRRTSKKTTYPANAKKPFSMAFQRM
jgi:hypothetical protein